MPKINQEIESFARIMVIGIGGSGKNAVNHMITSKVKGVSFISMNTDTQDLHHSLAEKKNHIGKNLTKGLGAGMNPDTGKKAAEETKSAKKIALWIMQRKKGISLTEKEKSDLWAIKNNLVDKTYVKNLAG